MAILLLAYHFILCLKFSMHDFVITKFDFTPSCNHTVTCWYTTYKSQSLCITPPPPPPNLVQRPMGSYIGDGEEGGTISVIKKNHLHHADRLYLIKVAATMARNIDYGPSVNRWSFNKQLPLSIPGPGNEDGHCLPFWQKPDCRCRYLYMNESPRPSKVYKQCQIRGYTQDFTV